jgi:mRNA-degrading endonuclease toxin of MazEF toxin-antitoxin module
VNRGDVVLTYYPFASGPGGKRRPGLVVQNNADNARMEVKKSSTRIVTS